MKETRFKNSQLGLIPEEWVEGTFSDFLTTFSSGATPYRGIPQYFKGNVRWITSGELNYNTIFDTIEHISDAAVHNTHLQVHKEGTFLMAMTGLEAEGTRGKCAMVGLPSTTNQSCLAINGTDKMDTGYLYYFYRYWADTLAFKFCQGTKQMSYTAKLVKKLPIYAPKEKSEQHRIASALTDVDDLIASLDKLIAKKQAVKQGAMQQLLTGKRRLEGFNEPWAEKKLGEILQYEQPSKYLVSSTDYTDKGVPVLTAGKTFILGYTNEYYGIYDNLPVIIFDDFVTESKYVTFPFKAKSSAMKMLTLKDESNDLRFVYEIMQTINFPLTDHKRYWINDYSKLKISIPSLPEQRAIANILTSMDDELAALAAKKQKYEQIKQGMMQQLLTGKIRLI